MTVLDTPRRVLLGRARFRWMLARCAIAWAPLLASVIGLALAPRVTIGLHLCVAVMQHRRGTLRRVPFRPAWWRTRWWADARAAGLCVIAEPGLNATHEAGRPKGVEIAPALKRVRCAGPSRLYVVRPLPGQVFATFEKATDALSFRWGAQVAVSEHPRRRSTILIEVVTADALARPLTYPSR